MKLTLILMRHAKSSWDSPTMADHDRPLNKRGVTSAQALGDWLRENDFIPDEALVSSAARTQETFAGLDLEIDHSLSRSLYHASADTLHTALNNASGSKVLILAHNPGIGELAEHLARQIEYLPDHPKFYAYPTGATFVVEWDADSWADIDLENGVVAAFVVPKDLN